MIPALLSIRWQYHDQIEEKLANVLNGNQRSAREVLREKQRGEFDSENSRWLSLGFLRVFGSFHGLSFDVNCLSPAHHTISYSISGSSDQDLLSGSTAVGGDWKKERGIIEGVRYVLCDDHKDVGIVGQGIMALKLRAMNRQIRSTLDLLLDVHGHRICHNGCFNSDPHPGNVSFVHQMKCIKDAVCKINYKPFF